MSALCLTTEAEADVEGRLDKIRALIETFPDASFALTMVTMNEDGTAATGLLAFVASPHELIYAADDLLDHASKALRALAPSDREGDDSREVLKRIETARAALDVFEMGLEDA